MAWRNPKTWVKGETFVAADLTFDLRDNPLWLYDLADQRIDTSWRPTLASTAADSGDLTPAASAYTIPWSSAIMEITWTSVFIHTVAPGTMSVVLGYSSANLSVAGDLPVASARSTDATWMSIAIHALLRLDRTGVGTSTFTPKLQFSQDAASTGQIHAQPAIVMIRKLETAP